MELELVCPVDPRDVQQRLNARSAARPGDFPGAGSRPRAKAKHNVRSMTYQFPVPRERRPQVEQAIEQLLADSTLWVERDDRPEPVDMRADLESLEWCDDVVRFRIRASTASVPATPRRAAGLGIGRPRTTRLFPDTIRSGVDFVKRRNAQSDQHASPGPARHDGTHSTRGVRPAFPSLVTPTGSAQTNTRQNQLYEKGNLDQRFATGGMPDRDRGGRTARRTVH